MDGGGRAVGEQIAYRGISNDGWWKTRPTEKRFDRSVAYSLVVSIETPDENTDIYMPVAQQVGIDVPVEITG